MAAAGAGGGEVGPAFERERERENGSPRSLLSVRGGGDEDAVSKVMEQRSSTHTHTHTQTHTHTHTHKNTHGPVKTHMARGGEMLLYLTHLCVHKDMQSHTHTHTHTHTDTHTHTHLKAKTKHTVRMHTSTHTHTHTHRRSSEGLFFVDNNLQICTH